MRRWSYRRLTRESKNASRSVHKFTNRLNLFTGLGTTSSRICTAKKNKAAIPTRAYMATSTCTYPLDSSPKVWASIIFANQAHIVLVGFYYTI